MGKETRNRAGMQEVTSDTGTEEIYNCHCQTCETLPPKMAARERKQKACLLK
jgi:hypothetical protein